MPDYLAIHGTFHVKGYSPDGDSIRFEATNPAHWADTRLKWDTIKARDAKKKQLRLEAIDAVETHYEGFHQPRAFGVAALELLLSQLGITGVRYNLMVSTIVAANDGVPGTICVRELDGNERPICFAYAGTSHFTDGATVAGAALKLEKSLNYSAAKEGLAYATFYSSFEADTMDKFRKAIRDARKHRRGLWALDRTTGFTFWDTWTIQDDVVILPKLFRRLVSFCLDRSDFSELADYFAKSSDKVKIIGETQKRKFSELLKIDGRRIELAVPPEDLIFQPKD